MTRLDGGGANRPRRAELAGAGLCRGPSRRGGRQAAGASRHGSDEQMFGAKQQDPHADRSDKEAQKPSLAVPLRKRTKALIIEGATKAHKP
jgi:hypothetical protein